MEPITRSKAYCLLVCAEAIYAYWKYRYEQTGSEYCQYIIAKSEVEDAGSNYLYACRPDKGDKTHD